MKCVSNNEVAKALVQKARDPQTRHVEESPKARQIVIEKSFAEWKGVPSPSPVDPLYDLEYMKVIALWREYGIQGQAANVAVIDSGCDTSHPAFAHTEIFERSLVQGDPSLGDPDGHGTWVCGKIVGQGVGIAPMCNLTVYRTLDANGSGTVDASVAALNAILKEGSANVVNISFGSPLFSADQEKAVNRLVRSGVIVCAAAGNYGLDTPFYPGSYKCCLTVAATNAAGVRTSFSDYGGQVDIAAPGVACYSTFPGGQFRAMTGTSMATPVVAGLLTLGVSYLKMVKNMSSRTDIARKVMSALEETAKDVGPKGKDSYYGFGVIDGLAFMQRVAS